MITLTSTRPTDTSSAPTGLEPTLASLPFYGRPLVEYVAAFDLDLAALRRCALLDAGSGPSSFAVDAARRGIEVAAVDPLYGCTAEALATHIQLDYARVAVDACKRLKGTRLSQREALEVDRRAAAQRFLADYESGFLHNRYIGGALPRLPFLDRAFDLVLCGHVLFSPYARFDPSAIVAACRELVRVSAGEARVAPLGGLPPEALQSVLAPLRSEGIRHRLAATIAPDGKRIPDGLLILRRS